MFLDYISAKREKEMFRVFSLKKREKEMFGVLCQNPIQLLRSILGICVCILR